MEIQVFKNDRFGEVRTMVINGEPWFVGKDVAMMLGYLNTQKAIRDHVDEEDKRAERIVHPFAGPHQHLLDNHTLFPNF